MPTKIILSIAAVIVFTAALLLGGAYLPGMGTALSDHAYLSRQLLYQPFLLAVSLLSIGTTYRLSPQNFRTYFGMGQLRANGEALKLMGIKQGDSWLKTGLSLCGVISVVTGAFLYFQLQQADVAFGSLLAGLPWILLFALTNSFGEEMIFRLGIVSPLSGAMPPNRIFLVSAILFGIPHYAGMPNGPVGVLMAGILGFVLAKSMYETKGFFWAWAIHFLQDVLIIGTLYLLGGSV